MRELAGFEFLVECIDLLLAHEKDKIDNIIITVMSDCSSQSSIFYSWCR